MIDPKNLVLISLGLLLIFYVSFEVIREKIHVKKVSCKDDASCVRFCRSTEKFTLDFNLPEFEKLNRNFSAIGHLCPEVTDLETNSTILLEDGKLSVEYDDGESEELEWAHYCLFQNENETIFYQCFPDTAQHYIEYLYPYFMLTSVPFLIITIFVYAWIPELRNLPGKCLMSYVASLILLYVVYGFSRIYQEEMLAVPALCKTAGYTQFLSLMMCFMWLNVLCYDVWSTIRKIQSTSGNILFLKYSIYGFGAPLLLTLLVLILNSIESVPEHIKHKLGDGTCFIVGGDEESKIIDLIYRIIPLGLMLSANIFFYSFTAFTIFVIQRQSDKTLTKSNNRFSDNKHRFFLYFRLFILMGISWIAELIAAFIPKSIILDTICIINCLQGVLIFMHFIWRSRVEGHIRKKLNLKQYKKTERVETTTSIMMAPATDTPSRRITAMPLNTMTTDNDA